MRDFCRNAKPVIGLLCLSLTAPAAWAEEAAPPDLMSFAQGALPVAVSSAPGDLRVGMDLAVAAIDGNPAGYTSVRKPATADDVLEITFSLPALTRFDSFAIPRVPETPSPSQTFFGRVEVLGAAASPEGPFVPLASADLGPVEDGTTLSALEMTGDAPEVLWVRLRLSGGVDLQSEKSFLEFSELIGTGTQAVPALSEGFDGVWSGRGVKLELEQSGATVNGCYDGTSMLSGTVQGNVLRALGADPAGIGSQFILIADDDGNIRGLRSTNGAPFKPYDGDASDKAPTCLAPEPARLGCGSVVHGIGFDFDSAAIRPASEVVIGDLYVGLAQETATQIQIVGHSSSEGSADYNRDLSQRRAQSVVAALVTLGLDPGQITALGKGEDAPIASNDDEAGRSLNRRVEITCTP